MNLQATPHEQMIAVNALGFDFLPFKQDNGMYRIGCWNGEKYMGMGKFDYKDWQEGIIKTYRDFYIKYILK